MRALLVVSFAVAATLAPRVASADAIAGAREDCPRGTYPTMPEHHGEGSMCVLRPTCDRSSQCGATQRCIPTAVCVDGAYVVGSCGPRNHCDRGRCRHAHRCAGPRAPAPPPGAVLGALTALGTTGIAAVVRVRRKRRATD